MPTTVQFRRGTTAQNLAFTGSAGEITVDTTEDRLIVHDGTTAGGSRQAKASETVFKVIADDSVGLELRGGIDFLHLSGGNGITTSTASTGVLTIALDGTITTVNTLSSSDSTEVVIDDGFRVTGASTLPTIATNAISSSDSSAISVTGSLIIEGVISGGASTQLVIQDGVNVNGDLVITNGEISSSDSSALNIRDAVNVTGALNAETSLEIANSVIADAILDEDDLSSDSNTALATQQSIKAYTDAQDASQSLTIVCDDSTGNSLIFTPGTPAFAQFEGGNSITTSSLSTGNIKFELDTDIYVNSVQSLDSSEVEILNIRTDTLVAHDSTQITIRDALRVTGTITGTVTAAQYADLAEKYLADQEYAPGTVMIFGGDQEITQSTDTHDARIAGVVSTAPAFIMNNDLEGGTFLGLTGRVPCRVKGAIAKGDMVTSSDTPGVAQKLDPTNYNLGCVIGKALENYSGTGEGVIEVVVGRV